MLVMWEAERMSRVELLPQCRWISCGRTNLQPADTLGTKRTRLQISGLESDRGSIAAHELNDQETFTIEFNGLVSQLFSYRLVSGRDSSKIAGSLVGRIHGGNSLCPTRRAPLAARDMHRLLVMAPQSRRSGLSLATQRTGNRTAFHIVDIYTDMLVC
eukprot:GHVU01184343.1.p1 GENE.GHVU01184343.1~~GHVU01184343.1.p1  ORF type:complete len:158 (-),score=2.34 GHVU01184343.1:864-1337(-)